MKLNLIIFSLLLFACKGEKGSPEVTRLYNEVMEVHDEVMPEMNTIHKLKKTLQNEMGSDSSTTVLIHELDNADEAMMSWMADFGGYRELKGEKDPVKLDYLENELQKIKSVRQQMIDAIQKAKAHIKDDEK